jgi:hypothetical protein
MDAKTFSLVAGVIFAVVALFHLARIFMEWTIIIGDWSVPMWVSWIAPAIWKRENITDRAMEAWYHPSIA